MPNRALVVPLVESYYPPSGYLRAGQVGADHIQKDWTGGGTTCGFVPFWLYWRMGCKDAKLLNRYEPDAAFIYRDSENMSRVSQHRAFVTIDKHKKNSDAFLRGDISPKAGDVVMIHDDGGNEHVFVVLDDGSWESDTKGEWRIVEGGQEKPKYSSGHITKCAVECKGGRWMVGRRWILGWLDLDQVDFGDLPVGGPGDSLSKHSLEPTTTSRTLTPLGVWEVTSARGEVWFYRFEKGSRVFWTNQSTPNVLSGSGLWLVTNGSVAIRWTLGGEERMVVSGDAAIGADKDMWTAKKIKPGHGVLGSYRDGRGVALNMR